MSVYDHPNEIYREYVRRYATKLVVVRKGGVEEEEESVEVSSAKASLKAQAILIVEEWDRMEKPRDVPFGPREYFRVLEPTNRVFTIQRSIALPKVRCLLVIDQASSGDAEPSLCIDKDLEEIFSEAIGADNHFPAWDFIQIPEEILPPEHKVVWHGFGTSSDPPAVSIPKDYFSPQDRIFEFDSTPWEQCDPEDWIKEAKRQHPLLGKAGDSVVSEWMDNHIYAILRQWVLWDFYWTLKEGRDGGGKPIHYTDIAAEFTACSNSKFHHSLPGMPLSFFIYIVRNYGLTGAKAIDYERVLIHLEFGARKYVPRNPYFLTHQAFTVWRAAWDGLTRVSLLSLFSKPSPL